MVFDKNWFDKKQNTLLWFLNTPIVKIWFRWVMKITTDDCKLSERIYRIEPNAFWKNKTAYGEKIIITAVFRTHDKYSKRLYYGFKNLWRVIHLFDIKIANKIIPSLNMGFDTLTVYPDASSGGDSCDGTVEYYAGSDAGDTWSNVTGASTGTTVRKTDTNPRVLYGRAGTTNNYYSYLTRGFFSFKTSSIGSGKQIESATMSLYCNNKGRNAVTWGSVAANVFSSTQTNANDIATGDYSKVGSTAFSTAKTYSDWDATSAYNDYSFNTNGKEAISTDGVSKFSFRESYYDPGGNSPGYQNGDEYYLNCYFADETGTTKDPKLVVVYSVAATGNFFQLF